MNYDNDPRLRADHDYDGDHDAELDRWLGWVLGILAFFGIWKVLDLGYWLLTLLPTLFL